MAKTDIFLHRDETFKEEFSKITGHELVTENFDGSPKGVQCALLEHKLSALCLSGGGIRSATFALGALQVLATHRLIEKFDYLSTVSGGGYIGSSITSWLYRHTTATPQLKLNDAWEKLSKLRRENYAARPEINSTPKDPIAWMRAHSNYLARRLSVFSADTYTVISTYFRNLFINWVVFSPWTLLFMFLPWLATLVIRELISRGEASVWPDAIFGVIAWIVFAGIFRHLLEHESKLESVNPESEKKFDRYDKKIFLLVFFLFLICVLAAAVFAVANPFAWNFLKGLRDRTTSFDFVLVTTLGPSAFLAILFVVSAVSIALVSKFRREATREWNARYLAVVFVFMIAWPFISSVSLFFPALIDALGAAAQSAAVAGSGATLSISIYFGFRANTPGAPGDRPPWFMTLLGTVGIVLMALWLGWLSWHAVGSLTGYKKSGEQCGCTINQDRLSMTVNGPVYLNNCGCARLDAIAPVSSTVAKPGADIECTSRDANCAYGGFTESFQLPIGKNSRVAFSSLLAIVLVVGLLAYGLSYWLVNYNVFSLHNFYRNRLIRAYYGGFRVPDPTDRKPNPFSGFDPADDLELHLLKELYKDKARENGKAPFLVINTALNLVKGENLAWQERKADSFTFTALHAGNHRLGYRNVAYYAGKIEGKKLRLGTAMAISGAAFNPNMGYNSSVPMGFLMTMFNVRLGWWLGNPRKESKTWEIRYPSNPSWTMLIEACGQTTDTEDWIHLSDGGHFDNLGLWEMVHRRCHRIVVIDASRDGNFNLEDLANAIRKIRIDQGIRIEPKGQVQLFSREAHSHGKYCSIYKIKYSDVHGADAIDGEIVYIKPCLYGTEPEDVLEFGRKHLEFPHQSTTDQFFSESQFESYRRLGEYEMEKILGVDEKNANARFSIGELFKRAEQHKG